jgi:predicted TIM-barrel fold metal-dependent hydrolase
MQLYGILAQVLDYGVEKKVLWGSDFPAHEPTRSIEQFLTVNERAGITDKPIPATILHEILYQRPVGLLGLE